MASFDIVCRSFFRVRSAISDPFNVELLMLPENGLPSRVLCVTLDRAGLPSFFVFFKNKCRMCWEYNTILIFKGTGQNSLNLVTPACLFLLEAAGAG